MFSTNSSAIAERASCRVVQWKTIFCRQYRSVFNHCDVTNRSLILPRWMLQLGCTIGVNDKIRIMMLPPSEATGSL